MLKGEGEKEEEEENVSCQTAVRARHLQQMGASTPPTVALFAFLAPCSFQVILYSFYKNITMVMTLFVFGFCHGHSGTTLYESWLGAGWNVGWTFLPIIAVGMYDYDVSIETVMKYPGIYKAGQANGSFSTLKLAMVRAECGVRGLWWGNGGGGGGWVTGRRALPCPP